MYYNIFQIVNIVAMQEQNFEINKIIIAFIDHNYYILFSKNIKILTIKKEKNKHIIEKKIKKYNIANILA